MNDITQNIAKNLSIRLEQRIAIVIKPKPRFLTQKMWLKLVSKFIYIERTQSSMQILE